MTIQEHNYWTTTVDSGLVSELDAPLPERVDVAIVGAGYTGLAAALALAKRGIGVAVLEAGEVGWGASSRNGGMVLCGHSFKQSLPTLIAHYGREVAYGMYKISLAVTDETERVINEEKIDCDYSRCGHLGVAWKQSHFKEFEKYAEQMAQEFGHRLKVIPKSELSTEIDSPIYYGGLLEEASGGLNPARYVVGLALAAKRASARIFTHTPVKNVEKVSRQNGISEYKFTVHMDKGNLLAKDVILATGAYTNDATPLLRRKVMPVGDYVLATEVLNDDLVSQLIPFRRMIFDSNNLLEYFRLTADNRLLFGATESLCLANPLTVRKSLNGLRRRMTRVFPQLNNCKIDYVWGGDVDFTVELMPHLGQIDGMYFAIGYAGQGVAMATCFGTALAGMICGDRSKLPFEKVPCADAPIGLRSGTTWALPLAELYYKFLDWLS